MKNYCSLCSKSFVWPHDLKRHMKIIHITSNQQQQQQILPYYNSIQQQQQQQEFKQQQQHILPYYNSTQQQQQHEHFRFIHPFTAICSGPTGCGKTFLIKQILENQLIEPPPQRIIWLYKRWQPLYDIIKNTVKPCVEFVQGIPIDLDKDEFINPCVRNLIVVDDLMSSTVKDVRFNDLFCEGSHHRNLSVIGINQNLYFSKDPTQRRNCHYLILFKNPVDKQQIITLARQMYPGKVQYFLDKFDKATQRPRDYLLVDLKVTTPEALRLRDSLFEDTTISKKSETTLPQTKITNEKSSGMKDIEVNNINNTPQFTGHITPENMPFIVKPTDTTQAGGSLAQEENMPSCDDCGLIFDTPSDVQRHVKRWCPENAGVKRKSEHTTEPYRKNIAKRFKSDCQVWAKLIGGQVFSDNRKIQNVIKKYIKQGYSQQQARHKAIQDNLPELSKDFRKAYVQLLINMSRLARDPVHVEIMKTAKQLETDFGMNEEEAIHQAIKLRKTLINSMIKKLSGEDEEKDEEEVEENNGSESLESQGDIRADERESEQDEEEEED